VLRLWPPPENAVVDDRELAEIYAHPDPGDRCYVRVNFVSSADGAVTVGGKSGGLSSPADRKVFGLLRRFCDVVLVGAGTVRAENYRGARKPSLGRPHPPPIAVVTASAELEPSSPLFTDTTVAPIVITIEAAPAANRARLAEAGATVVVVGEHMVAADAVLALLAELGLRRVLCEGGPRLFGALIADDAVDEICLTMAPVLAGGDAGRISFGAPTPERRMRLASALAADDSLLLRYQRRLHGDHIAAPQTM
jgi:5-amino-6-(5-phosphoribosylamino)uracil reductase